MCSRVCPVTAKMPIRWAPAVPDDPELDALEEDGHEAKLVLHGNHEGKLSPIRLTLAA